MNKEKFLYWTPRILGTGYIAFLGIFALDVFIPDQTLSYYLIAFLMHLLPNFVLLVLLLIAWKYERVGSLLFLTAFLIMLNYFWSRSFAWMQFLLFSPLLIISLLFFAHYKYFRR